jgi:hypothetical protein
MILICVFRPSTPPFTKKWIAAFHALIEYRLGRCLKVCHVSEIFLMEIAEPDIHRAELLLEHNVHILAMFRRIREAACVAEPWGLLEGRCYWSGRRGGFGDSVVDLVPDLIVRFVGEYCIQERFDTVEVEVVRSDGCIKS